MHVSTTRQPMADNSSSDAAKGRRRQTMVEVAKKHAVQRMIATIKHAIGVLRSDTAVPITAMEVLKKYYTDESLGDLAHWTVGATDGTIARGVDVDRQHEDTSLAVEDGLDGGEIEPEDDECVRLRNTLRTYTEARTTAVQSMIKAIILAIGEYPDDQTVPEQVRKVMEDYYEPGPPLQQSCLFPKESLIALIDFDNEYISGAKRLP